MLYSLPYIKKPNSHWIFLVADITFTLSQEFSFARELYFTIIFIPLPYFMSLDNKWRYNLHSYFESSTFPLESEKEKREKELLVIFRDMCM